MNFKLICLIAGLLGLPAAYANAASITIKVPVEITNAPLDRPMYVSCYVDVSSISPEGGGSRGGSAPVPRNPGSKTADYNAVVSVILKSSPAVDQATHYRCFLIQMLGTRDQHMPGQPSVAGTIPR